MTSTQNVTPGIPERIGRYRIIRPLSKGGMALVYEARRESLAGVAPKVAIKVILPDYATSATFRELFINEARLGAAMQHQNLVQIQDFDSDGERFFLVMEYVDGLTLSRIIGLSARNNLRIPLGVICEIGRQACDGLHYAHQANDPQGRPLGLIHRDIKPSNLILNGQGNVKILDFGISKGALRTERDGSVKGTWGYMSPEQAAGDRIGPNADIFGLGIVLYEMAARRSMFKGRKEEEIKRLLQDDHAARVASTLDTAFEPLVRVLIRALQRDPRARFATAADFGRALADLLPDPISAREDTTRFFRQVLELDEVEQGRPGKALTSPPAPTRSVATSLSVPAATASPEPQGSAIAMSIAAGLLVLISVAVLGWALVNAADAGARRAAEEAPSDPQAMSAVPVRDVTTVRPVPMGSVEALEPGEVPAAPAEVVIDRVVVRGKDVAPPVVEEAVQAEVVPSGPVVMGSLILSTVQEGKIYVDGELIQVPQGQPFEVAPGPHMLKFIASDGRVQPKQVTLAPGEQLKLRYDFDRLVWRN
jgi:serine/threonine protein kinase